MFMDLPLCLKEENFHFNETKGFFCLHKNGTDECLDDTKGTSRKPSTARKFSTETAEELHNLYLPFTRKLKTFGKYFGTLEIFFIYFYIKCLANKKNIKKY